MELTAEQHIQEEEYGFPYHHLPDWNPFTQSRNLWWGYEYAAYIEYLVNTLSTLPFTSLIDVGCGDGRLLAELSKMRPGAALYGTDFSEKALAFARAFSPSAVRYGTAMPKDEIFDAFTAIEVFEHIPPEEADAFLERIVRSLRPSGTGIITVPHANMPLNPKHYRHFTEESLTEALGKHFIVERIEHLNVHGIKAKIIQRLLANRLFILNWQSAKDWLYRSYKRSSLKAQPSNAMRLMAVVRAR